MHSTRTPEKPGEQLPASPPDLTNHDRPEQLVLQDDISFLPEFALPPPELLAELGLGVSLDSPHSGLSQSLTPFGSQQSSQSSHVAGYGLVLPSSTPDQPAAVGLEGGHCGQGDDLSNIDDLLQLDDPDFTFGEDGEIIEFTPHRHGSVAHAIPAAAGASSMHSDAGAASARVRQEHEEGQQRGEQVSFDVISHQIGTTHSCTCPSPAPFAAPSVPHPRLLMQSHLHHHRSF